MLNRKRRRKRREKGWVDTVRGNRTERRVPGGTTLGREDPNRVYYMRDGVGTGTGFSLRDKEVTSSNLEVEVT